jgi:hypothetical protein
VKELISYSSKMGKAICMTLGNKDFTLMNKILNMVFIKIKEDPVVFWQLFKLSF